MSGLMNCGICCMIISIWGTLQLLIMGICYKLEVVTLLEDVEEEEYEDYNDFIAKTQHNYSTFDLFRTGRNCFIAAGIYAVLVLVSYGCIITARKQLKEEERKAKDDELFCLPKPPPRKDPKKIL